MSVTEQTRDRVGMIFFSCSTPRAFLVRPALGLFSPENHKKKKSICFTRYPGERKSPLFLDQSERTSNLCQAVARFDVKFASLTELNVALFCRIVISTVIRKQNARLGDEV